MNEKGSYVLITPAKNEEALIGTTIESVAGQKCLPAEWVIVSDGSTDRTEVIVRDAAQSYPWIRLLPLPPRPERCFAAVVRATEAGVAALTVRDYDYIGLLDSDLRFDPDYFKEVLREFASSPGLGLAGGMVVDPGHSKDWIPRNREDIPGAVQFFRRRCFEEMGGLLAIPEGGWDALTCARARMAGFETRLLPHLVIDHLKPRNISEGGVLRRRAQMGIRDYALGYHPIFEGFKCMGRFREPPFLVSSLARWIGYCGGVVGRRERMIPRDLLQFVRGEQMTKIKQLIGLRPREERSRAQQGTEEAKIP